MYTEGLTWWCTPAILAIWEAEIGGSQSETRLWAKMQNPIWKIIEVKRTGCVAQEIECQRETEAFGEGPPVLFHYCVYMVWRFTKLYTNKSPLYFRLFTRNLLSVNTFVQLERCLLNVQYMTRLCMHQAQMLFTSSLRSPWSKRWSSYKVWAKFCRGPVRREGWCCKLSDWVGNMRPRNYALPPGTASLLRQQRTFKEQDSGLEGGWHTKKVVSWTKVRIFN
jgi:hypothetical protein